MKTALFLYPFYMIQGEYTFFKSTLLKDRLHGLKVKTGYCSIFLFFFTFFFFFSLFFSVQALMIFKVSYMFMDFTLTVF